jgi:thymidylate synthase ThyX
MKFIDQNHKILKFNLDSLTVAFQTDLDTARSFSKMRSFPVFHDAFENIYSRKQDRGELYFVCPAGLMDDDVPMEYRKTFLSNLGRTEAVYDHLIDSGAPMNIVRKILPGSIMTKVIVSAPLHIWAEFFTETLLPDVQITPQFLTLIRNVLFDVETVTPYFCDIATAVQNKERRINKEANSNDQRNNKKVERGRENQNRKERETGDIERWN